MAGRGESQEMRVPGMQLPPRTSTIVLAINGSIVRADIPRLCARVRALLERSEADRVVCELGALAEPDGVTVDALARLQLVVRRFGRQVRLRHASVELQELLVVSGLCDVLPVSEESRIEAGRQTEEREQVGVEEEAELDDPIA